MTAQSAWICLVLSALIDAGWAYALKRANGISHPGWLALSFVVLACLVFLLGTALKTLPLGIAYTVWTGLGIVAAVSIGALWLREPLAPAQFVFIAMVIVGVAGLRLSNS